ncbi:recombinase RecT [Rhizorhabdus histidinilytica]|uniref:Phage recombination protein Bet n=1 Tax=Rhizorhabdus histidinilytica TaxID=439228 RepID=A0A1T5BMY2_9SPHN|nr:recombinase RecT [Rhizorhabdus histidinilytica]SKB48505.1 phage recombination protein Bet [Rhizorhabdus histidinilytica]
MNQLTNRPARAAAMQRQENAIQQNVQRIEATKRMSALDVMAARLNITSTGLKSTLMNTVFRIKENGKYRSPTDDEFAALVIVANEYRLNPLTKEIYAYPAKGGGIVPVVSIDGWLRIINEHPQFDGMEHKDIPDENGKLLAIETTIWRKDRSRPIRIPEYLSECKQNTDPWRNMPARMLRHKSTIQCGRYAFGFAGIYAEGDAEIGTVSLGGDLGPMPMRDVTPRQDEQPRQLVRPDVERRTAYDQETGEILDDESDEETAARLDREGYAAMEGRDQ